MRIRGMVVAAIVPYRNRAPQLVRLIPELLRRRVDRVVVAEQTEGEPFNRGLAKNVGALKAGLDDGDTVYFHDVDLMPGAAMPRYPAVPPDTVVHYYGHRHCLGGVVGMTLGTFKRIGGFCNDQWKWGGEDRGLQRAAEAAGVPIDRTRFKQRFTADGWYAEMDSTGRVMPGPEAKRRFLQDPKVLQVPDRTVFLPGAGTVDQHLGGLTVSQSRVDPRVTTLLYRPNISRAVLRNPAAAPDP